MPTRQNLEKEQNNYRTQTFGKPEYFNTIIIFTELKAEDGHGCINFGYSDTNGTMAPMTKIKRIRYFIIICLIILLGLFSRRVPYIPLAAGDLLWAMMIFYMIRLVFVDVKLKVLMISSLAVCYLVEISQLYQTDWLNQVRNTLPGRLILGQGFLWSDIIAYTIGVLVAAAVDFAIGRITRRRQDGSVSDLA